MTRRELARRLAAATGLSARQAATVLAAVGPLITDELAHSDRLEWRGLGTFTVRRYPARRIHIPATGQIRELPARTGVVFKPSRNLLARLPPPTSARRRSTRPTSRRART